MAWMVWVQGSRGPSPQKVFDGHGDKPFLDAAIRDHVLSSHKLKVEEDDLGFDDLAALYPAPKEATSKESSQ